MENVILKVDNLQKTYKSGLFKKNRVEALKGVSFEVKKGEIFGLLGPNGAGKTTCIKILLGIVGKSSGDVQLFDQTAGAIKARQRIGYLPEHHRIPLHHTANSAMKFYGSLYKMKDADISAKSTELLEQVGLGEWGNHPVKKFSKGMQQRLGLAQALLNSPDLLILDEPTDGVDPKGRAEIRNLLKDLQAKGVTIFINSHLLQEMELLCDKIIIFEKGEVIHSSSVAEMTSAGKDAVIFHVEASEKEVFKAFDAVPELDDIEVEKTTKTVNGVSFPINKAGQDVLDLIVDALRAADISIIEMRNDQNSLEDAFLSIVKGRK